MKRFTILVTTVLLLVGALVAPATAGPKWLQVHQTSTATAKINANVHTARLWWRFRWPDGDGNPAHARISLDRWAVMYNMDGTHYSCDWAHLFKGVTYNLTVWQPLTGQHYEAAVSLPCSSSTQGSSVIMRTPGARFPYDVGGTHVRWKVRIHEHWAARADVWKVMGGEFKL